MIGAFLKRIRIKEKIRVYDVADICGVSQPFISNVENEKRIPTTDRICPSLSITFSAFLVIIADISANPENKKPIIPIYAGTNKENNDLSISFIISILNVK